MTKPLIKLHNADTDEVIEREMNDAEYAAYLAEQKAEEAKAAEEKAKADAKADLLAKLGITADEAKLLLG